MRSDSKIKTRYNGEMVVVILVYFFLLQEQAKKAKLALLSITGVCKVQSVKSM